jgi:hypothetical protein
MLMAASEARRAARGMFEMRTDKLADLHARVAALKRKAAALGVPVRKLAVWSAPKPLRPEDVPA